MSYSILQEPQNPSLSADVHDLILQASNDIVVKMMLNGEAILSETYTPDSDGKIYVTEIGKVVQLYLRTNGFSNNAHLENTAVLEFEITDGETTTTPHEYVVLLCRTASDVLATHFLQGNVFMHILKQRKWVSPQSAEYLTCAFTTTNEHKIMVMVTTTDFENSELRTFYDNTGDANTLTLDVSFATVAAIFPEIDPDTIIAYRMILPKEIAVFMVDREAYALPLQFRYLNSFDMPDTILTRGAVTRGAKSTFDTGKVRGVYTKFNIERKDVFKVSSGKIFAFGEYDRYREMFNSENVEVLFAGQWRKVIVTEEPDEILQQTSSLAPVSFSFEFANERDNNMIIGESFTRWILENGQWTDGNMWLDPEHWID